MELVVYRNDEAFGTAWAEEEGTQLHFRARCPFLPGIYRLYIREGNGETLPLGVLLPEDGMLTLHRTVRRPRNAPPGLDFFQYGILCEGDTQPDPISVSCTNGQEEPEKDAPYARLDRWLETSRPESFTEDEVLRKTLAGAQGVLYRYRGGCVELAVPASDHAHLAPVLLFTRAETLRGGTYFVLKLSAEGMPRRADEPSTN